MKQLKMGDIMSLVKELKESGMTTREINNLPIYIGDDDELNGIHCAWYRQLMDKDNPEDEDLVEMINDDCHCIELKDKAILIS